MIVNGCRLTPDPSGALYWPEHGLLAVADLHLEKGSAAAARGQRLLPPYDTRHTLDRLDRLLERLKPDIVICLGDSFHDGDARTRLDPEDSDRLADLTRRHDWIWVQGNHDPEPPTDLGGTVAAEVAIGGLSFRHDPAEGNGGGSVAGHLHPKACVRVRGRRLVRRCFATDGMTLVLPAFGAFTGGLDVLDPAFATVLPGHFHAYMLNRDRIVPVRSDRLEPVA